MFPAPPPGKRALYWRTDDFHEEELLPADHRAKLVDYEHCVGNGSLPCSLRLEVRQGGRPASAGNRT